MFCHAWCFQVNRKKTNLLTAKDTMTLIIITVVMGITQTVLYIAPVLGLNLSLTTRVYISAVIQLLVSLMETVETIFKQVSPRTTQHTPHTPSRY